MLNINDYIKTGSVTFPSVYPVCLSKVPLVVVDSFFYGKLVIAPLNILLYNVFTSHGPDLYGNYTQELRRN